MKNCWMRGGLWDSVFISFGWIPFYLWYVFGLDLGGELPRTGPEWQLMMTHLQFAILVVLGLTYIHRHYTLLLVYGEPKTFQKKSLAYVISPIVVLAFVITSEKLNAWILVAGIATLWNMWHVMMQRYGFLRIYAGRVGQGLEHPAHGRRDFWLLWSGVIFVVGFVALFQETSYLQLAPFEGLAAFLKTLRQTSLLWLVPVATASFFLFKGALWFRHEWKVSLTLQERLPRLSLLVSTFLILLTFLVSGPIVGYLVFGTAHALEYISFVHHYGDGKYRNSAKKISVSGHLFGSLKRAPLLIGGLGLLYYILLDYQGAAFYMTYYSATSLLHFLYDGWIWKVHTPEMAGSLGLYQEL